MNFKQRLFLAILSLIPINILMTAWAMDITSRNLRTIGAVGLSMEIFLVACAGVGYFIDNMYKP